MNDGGMVTGGGPSVTVPSDTVLTVPSGLKHLNSHPVSVLGLGSPSGATGEIENVTGAPVSVAVALVMKLGLNALSNKVVVKLPSASAPNVHKSPFIPLITNSP